MASQRIAVFGAGARLTLVRHIDTLHGQAQRVWWHDGYPRCLVRAQYDAAHLLVATEGPSLHFRATCGGARLMGMAASPAGDGLIALHEHPRGARLYTSRGGELVGEHVFSSGRFDQQIATDGRTVVLTEPRGAAPRRFADWSLAESTPWSLEPLRDALAEPCGPVTGLYDLGDGPLLVTARSWSRWRWDGQLLAAWKAPRDRDPLNLIAWHDAAPILHAASLDAHGPERDVLSGHEMFVWDCLGGRAHSLGQALGWPRGACSPDGRWLLVDRVTRHGRGLELWDLPALRLVERLDTRRRAVQAIAFAPDSLHVALATMDDLFVLRVEA